MKIAILNECFFKEKHINKLKELGELVVFENTESEDQAKERLVGVDIVILDCFLTPINKEVLKNAQSLKLIALNTTGYDQIPMELVNERDIKVADIPGFSTQAVAEMTLGLMLAVGRKILLGDKKVRQGLFEVDPGNKEHRQFSGFELKGKTLGLIGLGNIGQRVAELGLALGMKVIGFNRTEKKVDGVKFVTLIELLSLSDVVSLHLSFSSELENLIAKDQLEMMKPTAILINTSRNKLVNIEDLAIALSDKKIAGVGLDVMPPMDIGSPIFGLDNVVLTPHIGFFTEEALENMANLIVSNVENFIVGNPTNIVN